MTADFGRARGPGADERPRTSSPPSRNSVARIADLRCVGTHDRAGQRRGHGQQRRDHQLPRRDRIAQRITVKVGGNVLDGVVQIADKELDLCSLRVAGLYATPRHRHDERRASRPARLRDRRAAGARAHALRGPRVVASRDHQGHDHPDHGADLAGIERRRALRRERASLVGIVTFQHKTGQNLNFALPASWIFEMQNREASDGRLGARRPFRQQPAVA